MAETIEIANAYVALTTKMPGVKKDIENALGASDVQAAAEKSGSSLGGKLVKGVGGVAIGGIAAVAAAGIGTLSVALVKGFSRLETIDSAQAKMRGLGNSVEDIEVIMANASKSVKGTAFGLGDAATVAAQALAAGIKPGEEMQKVLTTVANSAAAAQTGLSDMGAIFAKVASTGKAQNDVLQQVSERGIDIYGKLGEQLGVTKEEVFSLASAGKIGFSQFEEAMTAAVGNVAKEMGGTWTGAVDNFGASLGRIGAGLLSGTFSQLAPTLIAITAAMEPLELGAAALGQKIGDFLLPAFEVIRNVLTGQGGENGGTYEWLLNLSAAAREVSGGFHAMFTAFRIGDGDITSSGFAGVMEQIGNAARSLVDSGLLSFFSPLGLIFEALKPLLPQIVDAVMQLGSVLGGALMGVLPTVATVAQQFLTILSNLAAQVLPVLFPVLMQLVSTVASLIPVLMPLVTTILTALAPLFAQLASALVPILEPLLALITPLLSLVTAILPPLVNLLQIVISAGVMALQAALSFLLPYIEGVANMIGTVLTPVIEMVQNYLGGLIEFITGVFTGDWEKAWNGIQEMFSAVWNGIQDIVRGVINGIIDLINGMLAGVSGFGDFLSSVTGGTVDLNIGQIPHLANGGVVTGSSTGTLALIGEAGRGRDEAVIPLPPDWRQNGVGLGGGDSTINVYPSPGMDEYTVGVIAGREAAKAARGF